MQEKEAKARIKINNLLISSGWRFFDTEEGDANVQLELNVKMSKASIVDIGEDFEKTKNGFVDFLLLDYFNYFNLVIMKLRNSLTPSLILFNLYVKIKRKKYFGICHG